jgi:ribonuclease I
MLLFNRLFFIFCWIGYCLARSNNECLNGPDFWCLNDTTEFICNFTNKNIGICGYSSKRCPVETGNKQYFIFYFSNKDIFLFSGDHFCKSSPPTQQSPLQFNGGLTGVDDNLFSYYILSLYWPPSSCPSKYNETIDLLRYFCSPYTDSNQPGSERLVLHGVWPTFSTNGNYQGWPQFCSSVENDWSKCHINGNLCPWKNATENDFTQGDYEYCLSVENREECLIDPTEILLPEQERLKIFAPGYLNKRNLFINHEWTKHGKFRLNKNKNLNDFHRFMLFDIICK